MEANTITAICALFVSVVATGIAVWSAVVQRKFMRLSVRPIAAVSVADFEERVAVYLVNKGLGPMLIKSLRVSDSSGTTHNNIIDHMSPLEEKISWKNFNGSVDGGTLENGKRIDLLVLEGDQKQSVFMESRDRVRDELKDLTVTIEYADLYGELVDFHRMELTWFGREK